MTAGDLCAFLGRNIVSTIVYLEKLIQKAFL